MKSSWRGIDEFVAVAVNGTFAGGAKALGASTTHVSRAIAHLESQLQAQLFYRTTRKVRLTETGIIFLERCQGILSARDEALTMISNAGTPHGLLRITCSAALGEYALIPILNDFAARYPEVRLSIDLSNRIADLIGEGYDLAIRTGNLADSRFIGTRIASRRLFTCASPAYLHKSGVPGSIMDLKHHDCLIGSSTSWHFVDAGKEQVYTPRGRWACNNGHAVLNAALADLGICQLPDYYVRTHVEAGELVPLLEECAPPDEPVWAVYPQRRHLSPNVRHLVDLLKERMPALMANPVTRSPDKAC